MKMEKGWFKPLDDLCPRQTRRIWAYLNVLISHKRFRNLHDPWRTSTHQLFMWNWKVLTCFPVTTICCSIRYCIYQYHLNDLELVMRWNWRSVLSNQSTDVDHPICIVAFGSKFFCFPSIAFTFGKRSAASFSFFKCNKLLMKQTKDGIDCK